MRRALKWTGATVLVIATLIAVVLLVLDWNMLRGPLAARVSQEAGRDFAIEGDLTGNLSLTPWIRARNIRLANAEWATETDMVRIEELGLRVDLRALARGRFVFTDAHIRGAQVHLEVDEEGRSNWDLDALDPTDEPIDVPLVESLVIEESRLAYRDRLRDIELDASVSSAEAISPDEGTLPVRFEGTGSLQGEPFVVNVRGGSLLTLRDEDEPYPVEVEARVGDTQAKGTGTIPEPMQPRDLDMTLHITGPNAELLAPILHIPIPATPPYELSGRLLREADLWRFESFEGVVGNSDLSGTVTVDDGRERPLVTADLVSRNLELADLGAVIGLPPGGAPTGEAEAADVAPARVFPDAPLQLEQIQATDARVTFRGEHVIAPNMPLGEVALDLELDEGVLQLAPLRFDFAGGQLDLYTSIYSRSEPVHTDYDLRLSGIRLQSIFDEAGIEGDAEGTLYGQARFSTTGDTIRRAMATAEGNASIVMGEGRVDGSILGLLDVGFLEAVAVMVTDGRPRPMIIRCFVTAFEIEDGLMRTPAMVLDTEDTLIVAEGVIDLGEETVQVRIDGEPKDPTFAGTRVPVEVSGRFIDLSVDIDPSELAARGGLAAALGAILAPLAALIPFVDLGAADDLDCQQVIEGAERQVE